MLCILLHWGFHLSNTQRAINSIMDGAVTHSQCDTFMSSCGNWRWAPPPLTCPTHTFKLHFDQQLHTFCVSVVYHCGAHRALVTLVRLTSQSVNITSIWWILNTFKLILIWEYTFQLPPIIVVMSWVMAMTWIKLQWLRVTLYLLFSMSDFLWRSVWPLA